MSVSGLRQAIQEQLPPELLFSTGGAKERAKSKRPSVPPGGAGQILLKQVSRAIERDLFSFEERQFLITLLQKSERDDTDETEEEDAL